VKEHAIYASPLTEKCRNERKTNDTPSVSCGSSAGRSLTHTHTHTHTHTEGCDKFNDENFRLTKT